ncbi:hypothetical protein J6590_045282 [Homalodisca vitripennis]|nr:hypothetical protein J6590_045282 [Homalodisca vitripennis]
MVPINLASPELDLRRFQSRLLVFFPMARISWHGALMKDSAFSLCCHQNNLHSCHPSQNPRDKPPRKCGTGFASIKILSLPKCQLQLLTEPGWAETKRTEMQNGRLNNRHKDKRRRNRSSRHGTHHMLATRVLPSERSSTCKILYLYSE